MLLITSPDPQDILALFVAPRYDEHMKAWRLRCFLAGNYHYFPKYSNRIVYGSREAAND